MKIGNLIRATAATLLVLVGMSAYAQANNVTAQLLGNLLKIEGDNLANQITVTRNAQGDVLVIGRNGTTVNRQPSVTFRRAFINAAEILMYGGNDLVVINNMAIANDLFINLGDGADRLVSGSLASTIGANLSIESGTGNDTVQLSGWTIGGDAYIDGQTGTLSVTLAGLTVGFALDILSDASNDTISCNGCITGDFTSIETKGGADQVTLLNHWAYGVSISTDLGADQVTLDGVQTQDDIEVNTGTENDTVRFTDVQSAKNIIVALDAGADLFAGTRVAAQFDAVFVGGAGFDTFQNGGVAGGVKTEIVEFERF